MSNLTRLRAAAALAFTSALLPLGAAAQNHPEMGFVPEEGFSFASQAAEMAPYTCNPATVGPNGRCASTAIPGSIASASAPQFLLLSFDDCITPGSEKYVRSVFDGSLRNPDGRPVPLTYFVSLENCPATGDNVWETDGTLVKARYNAGDEMAVHTRTHQTSRTTSYATWVSEMTAVRTFFQGLGLGDDAGRGFRSPYLVNNPAQFQALKDLGFLYDSTVLESPFWSPVSNQGLSKFTWPFTYDQYSASAQPQNCENWWNENGCPTVAIPGLWQIPLYYYIKGNESNATFLGAMDIGQVEYSGYEKTINGNALTTVLRQHINARLSGNRAPLNLFFHPNGFTNTTRVNTYKAFMAEQLRRGDVWAVTMQGLIEWMKAPVPNSQMKTWYAAYCTRHRCSAPATSGNLEGEAPLVEAAAPATTVLSVYPNPAREQATATVTTLAAGARFALLDVLGREVFSETLGAEGQHRVSINLNGRGAGVYLVRVTETGGRVQQQSLVIR